MTHKIDTVTARSRLAPRREPYWHKVQKGCFLGFRRMTTTTGTWIARMLDDDTKVQSYHALGDFTDAPDHQRFELALVKAREWFAHRSAGGSRKVITVKECCEEYVKKLTNDQRPKTAADAEARFKRWVYPNKRLGQTPVNKLTVNQLEAWRDELAKTPAIPQDKQKAATRQRSGSTINRDMTTLRAALNLALKRGHALNDSAWRNALEPLEGTGKRRETYLDSSQRKKLIDHTAPELVPFVRALCMIPLRPGAMANLKVSDYDKRLHALKISTDKQGEGRSITLPPAMSAFIEAQTKDKLPGAPLFTRADGKAWDKDAWKYPLKAAVAAAGLPPATVAYSLRHSVITDLIALHRLDTMTVALMAGTSVQMIDKHYGHMLKDHAADALGKMVI